MRRNLNRIKNISFDKSFADYLNMERGIVRGRVASLLRSSEIKPYVLLICTFFCKPNFFPGHIFIRRAGMTEDVMYFALEIRKKTQVTFVAAQLMTISSTENTTVKPLAEMQLTDAG